ncbi:MAG: ABC transporter permease subunit [Deltaproteobacteria bacterium]|nr:ABC transporter permease subunit [Deltaproteobacteria bacterium]
MRKNRFSLFSLLMTLLVLAAGLFFGSPFAALLGSFATEGGFAVLAQPGVLAVVATSLVTALGATLLAAVIGTVLGYHFTFRRRCGGRGLKAFFSLPLVLPPSAAGYMLLLAFGRYGLVGGPLYQGFGLQIMFTGAALVLAQFFVVTPLMMQAAASAFHQVPENLVKAARSLGADDFTIFIRILLPLSRPVLVAGVITAFARAIGEFGATMMVAGRLKTIPIMIYVKAMGGDSGVADGLSLLLVLLSFVVLLLVNILGER